MKSYLKYALLISFFLLNYVFCSQNEESCSNLPVYRSFRSYLRFVFQKKISQHARPPKETFTKTYMIRETQHRNRSKLEIDTLQDGDKKVYILDFDKNQMYMLDVDGKRCVNWAIDDKIKLNLPLGLATRYGNVAGPTAVYNLISGLKLENGPETEYRGMETVHCLNENKDRKYEVILSKKFQSNMQEVILKTKHTLKHLYASETHKAEYFYLDKLDEDIELKEQIDLEKDDRTTNDFWHIPDYCVEKGEDAEVKAIALPSRYEFTVQRVVDDQTQLSSIVADSEQKLIKLSRFRSNDMSLVLDLAYKVQYELNTTTCLRTFNERFKNYEHYSDLIEIMRKLGQLKPEHFVGQRACRGELLVCDAFSFNSSNGEHDSPDDIFDDSPASDSSANTFYTIYLHYDKLTKFHHLTQVKKQIFSENRDQKLMSTLMYDVYDFKSLNRKKTIDLFDCAYDDQHRLQIKIAGLTKKIGKPDAIETRKIEQETIEQILSVTNLTHYNLGRVKTVVDDTSLALYVMLIQPINDLFYFETFTRYKIPFKYLNERYEKRTLAECALLGKRNNWPGFQHCGESTCYAVLKADLFDDITSDDEDDKDVQGCLTKKRISDRQIDYISLPDSIRLIEERIKKGEFELQNGFNFQSFENDHDLKHIERESFFNLIEDGKCFENRHKQRELKCRLKSRLTDCILTCQSTNCNMFSLRAVDGDRFECCFHPQTYSDFKQECEKNGTKVDDYLIKTNKTACSLYELSYLTKFSRLSSKKVDDNDVPLYSLTARSLDECAEECLKYNQKQSGAAQCLSFDYCSVSGDFQCSLRSYNEHNPTQQTKLIDSNACSHYSANFLIDYHKTEFIELDNFTNLWDYNVQDCAKQCKKRDECSKFNFCRDKGNLVCQLESNQTISKDRQEEAICVSYVKNERLILDDLHDDQSAGSKNGSNDKTNYSLYAILALCFAVGLKVGSSIILTLRVISNRKRRGSKYYVKFRQEECAISIEEDRIEQADRKKNQDNSMEQNLVQELNSVLKERKIKTDSTKENTVESLGEYSSELESVKEQKSPQNIEINSDQSDTRAENEDENEVEGVNKNEVENENEDGEERRFESRFESEREEQIPMQKNVEKEEGINQQDESVNQK